MKFKNNLLISFFVISFVFTSTNAQSENNSKQTMEEVVSVTFECESCTKRNKFRISGQENHVFKLVQFPLEQELKPGQYKMTYWQNGVQQIHLPFSVNPKIENVIVVKE